VVSQDYQLFPPFLIKHSLAVSLHLHLDDDQLTEINKKLTPSLSLPDRECHDTTNIIINTPLLLRKVSDESSPKLINFRHDVEKERFDIVVECFVI
jgi:hypothetical protein